MKSKPRVYLAPSVVGMEACLSAHHVGRMLQAMGFEPQIISAIYVQADGTGEMLGWLKGRKISLFTGFISLIR